MQRGRLHSAERCPSALVCIRGGVDINGLLELTCQSHPPAPTSYLLQLQSYVKQAHEKQGSDGHLL